jgi:hypothetical protein
MVHTRCQRGVRNFPLLLLATCCRYLAKDAERLLLFNIYGGLTKVLAFTLDSVLPAVVRRMQAFFLISYTPAAAPRSDLVRSSTGTSGSQRLQPVNLVRN